MPKTTRRIIFTFALLIVIFAVMPVLSATDLLFAPLTVDVVEEETFIVVVSIDPKGVKNYTAKVELQYPADLLEITSFNFSSGWISVSQPGYELIDNTNGVMLKTAGFPGGISAAKTFGTVSFLAKKTGNGVVEVGGTSFVLDAENQNVLADTPVQIPLSIKTVGIPPVPEEEVIPPEEEIPEQLFDINLEIDEYSIADIQELTSRVIFTSFGKVPTPVNLTFVIEDEAGQEVHIEKDYIIVETEAVLTKKFESLELLPGKYTLRLSTLYNVDVRDEFKQEFEIIKPIRLWQTTWFRGLILLGILLVIFLLVGIKKKKSKQKEEL